MHALPWFVRASNVPTFRSRTALAGILAVGLLHGHSRAAEETTAVGQTKAVEETGAVQDGRPVTTVAPVLKLTQAQPSLAPPTNTEKASDDNKDSAAEEVTNAELPATQTPQAKTTGTLSEDGWRARKPGSPLLAPSTATSPANESTRADLKSQQTLKSAPTQPKTARPNTESPEVRLREEQLNAPVGSGIAPRQLAPVESTPESTSKAATLSQSPGNTSQEAKDEPVPQDDVIDAFTDEEEIIRDLRLPVRRPTIRSNESRREENLPDQAPFDAATKDSRSNERSRQQQADIEDFENLEAEPSEETANDEYDNPQLHVDEEAVTETTGPRRSEPVTPKPVLSDTIMKMQAPIAQCLQYYYRRPENARERTPWGMLHAILPFGIDSQVDTGRQRHNAIAWLAGNNPGRNLKIFAVTPQGQLIAREGVGLQGHQAQVLAIFAQAGVPLEYPLIVSGRRFSVESLVRSEMAACKSGNELTFTLIGLSNYLPTDTRWKAADGQVWDFERLLREELSQPVIGAACGGTHRLMGLSFALKQRKLEGLPITGQWARVDTYINDFIQYAWELQNRDGSFSTNWFEGREDRNDPDRKLQTTGHILEWLVYTLPADELTDPRVTRSISFVANSLIRRKSEKLDVGPKGHALRAISLYHTKMYDSDRPWLGNSSPRPQSRTAQTRSTQR